MSKNKIQNYLILEFLKNYATLLLIFSLVIWLMQAVRLLDLIYEDGNTFLIYIKYIFLQLPRILSKLSVIVFFITFFWTLNILEESNEIKTISFFGIEPKVFFFKFLKFSFFFSIILIFFKAFIVTYSNKKSRDLLNDEGISSFSNLLKDNNFNNPSRKTTVYVEEKNKIGELKNIIIFQENEIGGSKVIIAKNGFITKIKGKSYFITEKGIIQEIGLDGKISQISFDKTTTDIENFKKKSADYYKITELSFIELINIYKKSESLTTNLDAHVQLVNILLAPFIIVSIVLLLSTLFTNYETKISKSKLKFFLFTTGFLAIFVLEILITYASKKIFYLYFLIFYLLSLFLINLFLAVKNFNYDYK